MSLTRVFAVLALFTFQALFTLQLRAETDFRFAFPQSEILLGVDLKWMIKSPFGTQLRTAMQDNLGEFKKLESLLDQIDTVHLSAVSKNNKQSDVLFLVQGKFDSAKLVEFGIKNGLKLEQWGKIKVLVQPVTKPAAPPRRSTAKFQTAKFQTAQFKMDMPTSKPLFAIYDAHNIVIGEEGPVRVALERMETGLTPQANPLFERARNLEASNDVWLIGSTAPLNLPATAAKGSDPMSQMASQIRNFSVGVAVRRNIALDLQLQATSPKSAAQMLDMLKGVVAMAKMGSKDEAPFPIDLDQALELSASGNTVRASLNIDQAQVEKLMVSALAPPTPTKVPAAIPAPSPIQVAVLPPMPVAPVRKTVMIYGLPGGPKEVPVN